MRLPNDAIKMSYTNVNPPTTFMIWPDTRIYPGVSIASWSEERSCGSQAKRVPARSLQRLSEAPILGGLVDTPEQAAVVEAGIKLLQAEFSKDRQLLLFDFIPNAFQEKYVGKWLPPKPLAREGFAKGVVASSKSPGHSEPAKRVQGSDWAFVFANSQHIGDTQKTMFVQQAYNHLAELSRACLATMISAADLAKIPEASFNPLCNKVVKICLGDAADCVFAIDYTWFIRS